MSRGRGPYDLLLLRQQCDRRARQLPRMRGDGAAVKRDVKIMLERTAEREGVARAEVIDRALRAELQHPAGGRLYVRTSPGLNAALHNAAARLGVTTDQFVSALLRDHTETTTLEDVLPELRRKRARERAKALLNA